MVFQISAEDVERSSTLEGSDVGCWAFVMNGTTLFLNVETREAIAIYDRVIAPV